MIIKAGKISGEVARTSDANRYWWEFKNIAAIKTEEPLTLVANLSRSAKVQLLLNSNKIFAFVGDCKFALSRAIK